MMQLYNRMIFCYKICNIYYKITWYMTVCISM